MSHLSPHPQCGVCTDLILRHERVIALIGNDDSTSYRGQTRLFLFPGQWANSPQFIPIHHECFNIFQHYIDSVDALDSLHRLWTAAAWRSPWRGARPIHFMGDRPDTYSLKALAQICQLSQLCNLPPELLSMIQGYSEHALFWRAISAHSLAARVSSGSPEPLSTMPLCDILFWKRGGKPEIRHDDPPPCVPTMRLTIDSDGISQIERISNGPSEDKSRVGFAYIVEQEQALAQCAAQFKDGLLQLVLPCGQPAPRIWNTPNPPESSLCRLYIIRAYPSWPRFFAIDTGTITGITFFFSSARPFGIHPHYSSTSDAMRTYCRFPNRRRRGIVWIYQPITKHDRVLALGVRKSLQGELSILMRTEYSGDVTIGSYISGPARDRCLGWYPPITLIYNEPIEGQEISFLGASHGPSSGMELPKPFAVGRLRSNPVGEHAYFSMAPLKDVASAEVFYDEDSQSCRGIMFRYHDGTCRAVGQCRVHVDATKWVYRPSRLCYRIDTHEHFRQVVYSLRMMLQEGPHHQDSEGWSCHELDGMLNFWFTPDSSFIDIES
ncbi:hypothetical protein F5B20DRAFT_568601 [Whalleya microplaca]|nr:hypothetical protein F5B20DRAFT_568601 [Whalleya microplaca]